MEKIVLKHLTGARADQVDQFPADGIQELVIGRDIAASIRFDGDHDDLVSRQHSKIVRDPSLPNTFQIVDLQSRNGTFLNGTRVYGVARLSHGDVIQLGAGGPEFRFELSPPPVQPPLSGRATREVSPEAMLALDAKNTRESWTSQGAPRPVGRATVERMLGDVFTRVKRESNRSFWVGLMALIATLAVGAVIWLYLRESQAERAANESRSAAQLKQVNEQLKQNPAEIAKLETQIANLEQQLQQTSQRNASADAANRALLQELRAKLDEANRAIAERPRPTPPPAIGAANVEALIQQATDAYHQGRLREAFGLINVALAKDDKRWDAYDLGGRVATALEDYSNAVSMYEKALQLAPTYSRADLEERLAAVKQKTEAK